MDSGAEGRLLDMFSIVWARGVRFSDFEQILTRIVGDCVLGRFYGAHLR